MLMGMEDFGDGTPQESVSTDPTMADPTVTEALTKTRRVQVKLTADKLLSDKGLPYLMKHAPKRLRISTSRNSPYDNLSHIVRFYQLWAHELFPKAKFKDFVKITRGLKNDRALKEYRTNLCLDEMAPTRTPRHESPQDRGQQEQNGEINHNALQGQKHGNEEANNALQDDDDDLYTDSAIDARVREQETMLDTQVEEDFHEDEEALEAMKEMGF